MWEFSYKTMTHTATYNGNKLEVTVFNNDYWVVKINGSPCADYEATMEQLSDGYKLPYKFFTSVKAAQDFAIAYVTEAKITKS